MSCKIYIEGGGDSKELHSRCREGFRRLLESCEFIGKMPRLIACGSRDATYDDFKTAHNNNSGNDFIALLVDSEEPITDIEQTWTHLKGRDGWEKPATAHNEQVLMMATCMETWIATDHVALRKHYGTDLKENKLPALVKMEERQRHDVQNSLAEATASCKNRYEKGKRSFEVLAELRPAELRKHLPSFGRMERVLTLKL